MESNSEILLAKIKEVNKKGWIKTLRKGDTGVGYTLETELGIRANSNQKPDFHGIEIKAFRNKDFLSVQSLVPILSEILDGWKGIKN
mgnify:CR=1 FL=1